MDVKQENDDRRRMRREGEMMGRAECDELACEWVRASGLGRREGKGGRGGGLVTCFECLFQNLETFIWRWRTE